MKRPTAKEIRVFFADRNIGKAYRKLAKSDDTNERQLFHWIEEAGDELKKNPFCGIEVPKRINPKEYARKYSIDNLWKYDLPKGWHLIYTVVSDDIVIMGVILEWFDHKQYERRFGY